MAVSPFSDGTPGASQWPIPPSHYFDYELEIEPGHAGTYFYHSHVGFQAVTAAGALVVEEAANPPYEYDEERIIALSDVFEKEDVNIEEGLLANPFQWSGETANVLVNGKGQLSGHSTSRSCELATIDIEPDKTYRFRFIGGTALSFVTLAFEDHDDMTLIEADGDYTKPINVSYLQIGSGKDLVFYSRLNHATPIEDSIHHTNRDTRPSKSHPLVRSTELPAYQFQKNAVSRAKINKPTHNTSANPSANHAGWLDGQLESLYPDPTFPLPTEVTRRVVIRTHQILGNGTITWAQDSAPWIESFPREPYLVSLYKNDSIEFPSMERARQNEGIDPTTRAFPALLGEVLEIILQNTGSDVGSVDVHPFHAHGAHYYDLGSGKGTYDPVLNEEKIRGLQLAKRDTTMLYRYNEKTTPGADAGWRAWRLRVTQPGVWMVHCHIMQHMVMGMQTVWVMGMKAKLWAFH